MKTIRFLPILILFLILSLIHAICSKETHNAWENRDLSSYPSFSISSFLSGSYSEKMEQALNDHMPKRDGFQHLHALSQYVLGVREVNGVLIGNQQLYQKSEVVDEIKWKALAENLNAFAKKNHGIRFDFLLVPSKSGVIVPDHLKAMLKQETYNQSWFLNQLSDDFYIFDAKKALLESQRNDLYYRGDHHWTTHGAYVVYDAWRRQRKLNSQLSYETLTVNDAFYGTLSNRSGFFLKDRLEIYQSDEQLTYLIRYVEEQEQSSSLYVKEKQYSANPYEVFLGGNHARVDIDIANDYNRTLLLIKDSYANCFVPFLLPHYQKIIMIDPRLSYDRLQSIILEEDITEIMFLYNTYTFFHDISLYDMMDSEMN